MQRETDRQKENNNNREMDRTGKVEVLRWSGPG